MSDEHSTAQKPNELGHNPNSRWEVKGDGFNLDELNEYPDMASPALRIANHSSKTVPSPNGLSSFKNSPMPEESPLFSNRCMLKGVASKSPRFSIRLADNSNWMRVRDRLGEIIEFGR